MKKLLSAALVLTLALGLLAGCGTAPAKEAVAAPKLRIVTTIFPIYDWVLNMLGEQASNAEVTMLLDNGVDLHSYQPTADDIVRISACDLFIYTGGESDEWVKDALQEATNKNMVVINLMEVLGDSVKEEVIVEGMEQDHDHDQEEEHDHEEDHDAEPEEVEYDEHVWLSLKNAAVLCRAIADVLGQINSENAALYGANADAYIEKLSRLDALYQAAVKAATQHTLLFADRFPFRYLTDDYSLDYYAAFVGCSAETEASFETIIFLAGKLDELGLPAVLQIESADGSIARTVVENTQSGNQQILTMDSMQSTTAKDAAAGENYLSIMEKNLDVLKAALG
ncbi:MAG: metal ABC transporter substrate-binding protein [Oscillospiraceae bacterium]|nr:metal ABC transporter substrate-binding protein [Oscillospiraceae bacterium]